MPLTLNQFLLLIVTIAFVVAITYLILVLNQVRALLKEGRGTLLEFKRLVQIFQETNEKVNIKIDGFDQVLEATKKTATSLSEIAFFTATRLVRPSSRYWPFLIPLVRLGTRLRKKKKENKHGK